MPTLKAAQAFQLRLEGASLEEIAAKLGFKSTKDVAAAIEEETKRLQYWQEQAIREGRTEEAEKIVQKITKLKAVEEGGAENGDGPIVVLEEEDQDDIYSAKLKVLAEFKNEVDNGRPLTREDLIFIFEHIFDAVAIEQPT